MRAVRRPFDGWLSCQEAALLLGVSASRVSQLRRERQLPAEPTPLGHLYRRADIEALLVGRRVPQPAA